MVLLTFLQLLLTDQPALFQVFYFGADSLILIPIEVFGRNLIVFEQNFREQESNFIIIRFFLELEAISILCKVYQLFGIVQVFFIVTYSCLKDGNPTSLGRPSKDTASEQIVNEEK